MLFQRQVLARLGGWDERFLGWGAEDDAMDIKVHRSGLRGVILKGSPGFHLAHRRAGATIAADLPTTITTSHCFNNSAQCPMTRCAGCAKSPRSSLATRTCIVRWKNRRDPLAEIVARFRRIGGRSHAAYSREVQNHDRHTRLWRYGAYRLPQAPIRIHKSGSSVPARHDWQRKPDHPRAQRHSGDFPSPPRADASPVPRRLCTSFSSGNSFECSRPGRR